MKSRGKEYSLKFIILINLSEDLLRVLLRLQSVICLESLQHMLVKILLQTNDSGVE